MPILDASFLIDLEKGVPRAVEILQRMADADEDLLVPAQAAIELLAGRSDALAEMHAVTRAFTLLDLDHDTAIAAAEIARSAFEAGAFPGWADVQIAAAARLQSTWILTADGKDFARMRVDHWDYRRGDGPTTYDDISP